MSVIIVPYFVFTVKMICYAEDTHEVWFWCYFSSCRIERGS